jgi:hypothetical protein
MPGLATGTGGELPPTHGALFEAGTFTQVAAIVLIIGRVLSAVGVNRLQQRGMVSLQLHEQVVAGVQSLFDGVF